jgi:glycerol kinase
MGFLLALDQGTTSSRAVLFRPDGSIHGIAQREFPQIYPKPGWVEHDPLAIWSSQLDVAVEVLSTANVHASEVMAAGITNQRETTILWDRRTGEPVMNAIVWQDRRTAKLCEKLKSDGLDKLIQEKTGLVIDAYFSASKLRWMLDNVVGARERAEKGELAFGTIDTWLIWNLTLGAVHSTDASNASRTMLFNIHTGEWDEELLGIFGIPRAVLPTVRGSSEVHGEIAPPLLAAAIPIAGVAGDQQAALFGQACFRAGVAKNTYGTGCFLLMNSGTSSVTSRNRLLSTVAWKIGAVTNYALEGSVFIGGAVVQWLRDGLGIIRSSADVEALASSVPDTGGVFVVPAFAGLGAPHWDPFARGAIVGITRGTSAAHIARAALEAIAFQSADLLDAMHSDSGLRLAQLKADGGASRNDLLMQFQADLLGVPVVRPAVTETTALGAACLAGLAVGEIQDQQSLEARWKVNRSFEPKMGRDRAASLRAGWQRAVGRSKNWEES